MKAKSIFAATLLVAGAAFADSTTVETDCVLGVLPLTVGKETIINIPWVEAGSASDATTIAVENIVKTANLEPGDELYYYDTDGGAYQVWKVNSSTNAWEGVTVSSASGASVADTHVANLTRGGALILNRVNSFENKATLTVYVIGQVPATSSTITIAEGYTLFAPPAVSGTTPLSTLLSGKAAENDQLILGVSAIYTFDGSNWTQPTYTQNGETGKWEWGTSPVALPSLAAGTGVFYYRAEGNDSFTLTFTAN